MAEFKGVVQTLAHSYTTPAQLAYAANRVVYSHTERKAFISAVVAKLDPANRFLTFARAGHPPIMYCSGDDRSPQNLMSAGIGIGLDSGDTFNRILEEKTVRLIPGASVVLYTDGVTEARNAKGEEFSEERLGGTPASTFARMRGEIRRGNQGTAYPIHYRFLWRNATS